MLGVGVAGVEPHRLLEVAEGEIILAESEIGIAARVEAMGVVGIEQDGVVEITDRATAEAPR